MKGRDMLSTDKTVIKIKKKNYEYVLDSLDKLCIQFGAI